MKTQVQRIAALGTALVLAAMAAQAADPAPASVPNGAAPAAKKAHDQRSTHLRLRKQCEDKAKAAGMQGDALKVKVQLCLQQRD
jgi:hypothetical protein